MASWNLGRSKRFRLLSFQANSWWRSMSSEATSSRAAVAGGSRRFGYWDREKRSQPCSSPTCQNPFAEFNPVRSYAAPPSANKTTKKKTYTGPRLNGEIVSEYIRLVTDDGHGIMARVEALRIAKSQGLDLVEVDRLAKPPVCKIMDYHRERYKKAVKDKERAKSKAETSVRTGPCKEVHFKGTIEQRDLEMKAEMVKRLMESGYRVKIKAQTTKTAGSFEEEDLGSVLSRLYNLIEDISVVEGDPRVEKRAAYVIVRHAKFGMKKNPARKVSSTSEPNDIKQTPYPQEDTNGTWRQETVLTSHQIHVHSSVRTSPNALPTSKPFHPAPPANSKGVRNEQNHKHTDLKSVQVGVKPELDPNSEKQGNRYAAGLGSDPLPELSNRYKKSIPTGKPTGGRMQPQSPFWKRNEGMQNSNHHHFPPGDVNNRDRLQNHNRYPPNGSDPLKSVGKFNPRQDSSSNHTDWKRGQENAP